MGNKAALGHRGNSPKCSAPPEGTCTDACGVWFHRLRKETSIRHLVQIDNLKQSEPTPPPWPSEGSASSALRPMCPEAEHNLSAMCQAILAPGRFEPLPTPLLRPCKRSLLGHIRTSAHTPPHTSPSTHPRRPTAARKGSQTHERQAGAWHQ